jgi:hypothetical protein
MKKLKKKKRRVLERAPKIFKTTKIGLSDYLLAKFRNLGRTPLVELVATGTT